MEIYDKLSSLEPVLLKLSELGYNKDYITIDDNVKHSKNIEKLMDELFPPNKTYDIPNDVSDIEYNHYFKQSGSEIKNNISDSVESDFNDLKFNDIDCNVVMYGKFKSTINPNVVNDKTKLTKEVYKSIKLSVDDANETIGLMSNITKPKSIKSVSVKSVKETKGNSIKPNSTSIKHKSSASTNSTKQIDSTKSPNQKYYDYITSCQKIKSILSDSNNLTNSQSVIDKLTGGVSAESILDNLKD